jgi:hypothetical protein|tara:strand:- start:1343 stop:1867 length:525 start_codon:yes stop_codon:yes gene_type:complete
MNKYDVTKLYKDKTKIKLIINSGDTTTIDYSKALCFKPNDIQNQYKWSFDRNKFHDHTRIIINDLFCNTKRAGNPEWNIDLVFSKNATIQHKQIIGILECALWSIETMKKYKKSVPICYQYPEANLHPHQQSLLADIFNILSNYGDRISARLNNEGISTQELKELINETELLNK